MNTTEVIVMLIAFFIIIEFLTLYMHNESRFIRGYIAVMRCLLFGCCIIAILCVVDEYKAVSEANEFKKELIDAYDMYNKGAEELLDSLDAHYNWIDGFDNIDYYRGRALVDSLYATQL